MKTAERWAAAVTCTIFAAMMVWCGAPGVLGPTFAPLPVENYFPDEVSAAVRLTRYESAFGRHWERRGFPDTDEAIVEVLRAVGPWEEWTADIGERAAERRVSAYREAFFQLLGPESWLVFGQWQGAGGEPDEPALLLYLKEGAAIRLAIGPFLDLMLPEKKTEVTTYRGVEILKYTDPEERNVWTMARLGGWVCVSMRYRDSRALYRIVDQYLAARTDEDAGPEPFFARSDASGRVPALSARILTEPFWRQLEEFNSVREDTPGEDPKKSASARWKKQLRKISSIEAVQTGDSIFDLDLAFRGERVDKLERAIAAESGAAPDPPLTSDLVPDAGLPLSAVQLDFSYAMATRGLTFVGMKWKDFLDELDDLKWIAPGLGRQMKRAMYRDDGPEGARIGASLTRTGGLPLPAVSVWRDHPPVLYTPFAPADVWAARAHAHLRGESDYLYASMTGDQLLRADERLIAAERELAHSLWRSPSRPPELFGVMHFDEVLRWMDEVPALFVAGSDGFQGFRHFARGTNLAAGSIALRLDVQHGEAVVRIRTLEAPAPFVAEQVALAGGR